jgi:hypothetical protein
MSSQQKNTNMCIMCCTKQSHWRGITASQPTSVQSRISLTPMHAADALSSTMSLRDLTHVVITHLDPKSIPTLAKVLGKATRQGARPTVVLSNPALQLLQSTFGRWPCAGCDPIHV